MKPKVKYDLPRALAKQLEQGKKVASMAGAVMTGNAQVAALVAANTTMEAKMQAAQEARQAAVHATAEANASASDQRDAYFDLGNDVEMTADGDAAYILSTGLSLRANPTASPELEPPVGLRTKINGTPGRVIFFWMAVLGAWNYEVQYTTDLTGATGWTDAPGTTGKTKMVIEGLTSGTKYAFRVRALNSGAMGPWSVTIAQMVA